MSFQNNNLIYFFIGTEAELIKIYPIILKMIEKNINYKIIVSGQNELSMSKVLKLVNNGKIDLILSDNKNIKKSFLGLFSWFIKTYFTSFRKLKKDNCLKGSLLIVHGDTISTVMGAILGNKLGMKIVHIEAGLRSFDFFNPFPEEICRIIVSRYTKLHFAPNQLALDNLKKAKGEKINTQYNTIADSLFFSENINVNNDIVISMKNEKYFVFVIHRQENLIQKNFVVSIITQIMEISQSIKCLFILHEPTKVALKKIKLLTDIEKNKNIITTTRIEYFDFMKILKNSQFVITDGGSNQEELYYMGKPCLILRKKTERNDGIGKNAVLYSGNIKEIKDFSLNYNKYKFDFINRAMSPSDIILNELQKNIS
jgi:UDP-N-acetylglucosamine 2-epimerase (non-hydrolysing)